MRQQQCTPLVPALGSRGRQTSVSLRLLWPTEWISGQPGLCYTKTKQNPTQYSSIEHPLSLQIQSPFSIQAYHSNGRQLSILHHLTEYWVKTHSSLYQTTTTMFSEWKMLYEAFLLLLVPISFSFKMGVSLCSPGCPETHPVGHSKNMEGCNRKWSVCGGGDGQLSVGEGVQASRHSLCSTAAPFTLW